MAARTFDREVPKRQKLDTDTKNTVLDDFLAWCKQYGIKAPKVAVRKGGKCLGLSNTLLIAYYPPITAPNCGISHSQYI
jgi:hypothetical protein